MTTLADQFAEQLGAHRPRWVLPLVHGGDWRLECAGCHQPWPCDHTRAIAAALGITEGTTP